MYVCLFPVNNANMGRTWALTSLLAFSVISNVTGQYYDVLQGLQQLFQQYQPQDFINQQYNVPTKPPQNWRHQGNRRTQAPTNQYEYTFATTEHPVLRKNSSHTNFNSRNLSNKNENSNVLLGDLYPYGTTKAPKLRDGNRGDNYNQNYPSDNPLINRPGVKPAPVNDDLPPITNRPVFNNNNGYNRPTERPVEANVCERYKALTIKKIVALPLVPSPDPVEVNVSDCTPINVPLIIGVTCNRGGPPQAVQLGSSYLDDPGALVVKVQAVIRHPKYKQRRAYHDIALIKLANKVKFSEVIRPACLGEPPPEGKSIIATGWGRTEFGGDHSFVLRSVSLPVWNMEECREGDSGGPVQLQSGCVWRIVGVTSYGRSCGAPHTPALYARLPRAFVGAQLFGENYQ
ncbi:hypothetical protein SFRURICE_009459 [Spodoptera frugiperda]|nr:hypothetical protein SFRURICE_009459 [Spodoptera frugiperda]